MMTLIREFFSAVWEVLKLPFFLIGEGFRRLFRLGWRKLTMLVVAAAIVTVVALTTFFEITSQPEFCSSCHIMKPYVAAWKTSSHSNVSCMTCHARKGFRGYMETKFTALSMLANYATGLYKRSRPWAEIEDSACLQQGCHETRLLEGKIEMASGVKFDHTPHLTETRRGRKLRCTSCHSQIVQGEHISVTTTTCFLCHFKNLDKEDRARLSKCTMCHNPPTGQEAVKSGRYDHEEILSQGIQCESCHQPMWQGQGKVRKERCGSCHSQINHIERFNDLEFIHEWHIEKRKVDCQRCHDPIEHKQPDPGVEVSGKCNACHGDQHGPMTAIFEGKGSRLVKDETPDVMYQNGVVCMSCHKNPLTGHGSARVGKDACEPCHKASYLRLAEGWKQGYGSRISTLKKELRHAGRHPKIEDARHDLALLEKGGAWHNPRYADAILSAVNKVVQQAGGKSVASGLPKQDGKCLVCHAGIDAVKVDKPFSPFNHANHLAKRKIACETCHVGGSPEDPVHGSMRPVGASCASCHHGKEANAANNCEPCHIPSRDLYLGTLPGQPQQASPMADAGMSCTDCHDQGARYQPPKQDVCLNCHDAETMRDLQFVRGELHKAAVKVGRNDSDAEKIIKLDNGRAVHNPDLARSVLGLKK